MLWVLLAVSAVGIAAYAVPPYLTGNPADSSVPIDPDVAVHYLTLAVHAVPGGLAMIIGPFQFVNRLRVRRPRLHRIAGRVYMVSVLIATVASLFAATFSLSGFAVRVGFYLLAAAWLYTLVKGYRSIRRGEVGLHRIWMIRNYALTFAGVTLRVYLILGLLLKQSVPSLAFDEIYTAAAWASILGNVLVAEYFILHRTTARRGERTPQNAPVLRSGR
ncbi:DUF2306 domain-containing protein [Actinosynnema sp. CS-041913]|uniref:DUF2306 domain-containing protein n=1 Tax=Actinosynnema sp. CS-041913 TaxID=3239917 RepID=UPI003D91028E